jgi:hypothetical protein
MTKATDLVWEEADEESYSSSKWSVSSVVVPTRPPTKRVEESPSSAMPSEDGPEEEPR